jgi:hypothetical protein
MQPASERFAVLLADNFRCAPGQIGEHALGEIARGGIGFHLAHGGGIDEVGVALDQFAEGGFITPDGVGAEQLMVGCGVHSPIKQPAD